MALIVQKFGGTSVADLDRIRAAASKAAKRRAAGDRVCVVLSAMAGETNKLVGWVDALDPLGEDRDAHDVVVASGEQVTIGLMCLALRRLGWSARAYLGWQAPIETDGRHGAAKIGSIPPERLRAALDEGVIPVVAGFQGVTPDGRVTTLGRGGSDTSAVALAAALDADLCQIYTDVDGVYTTDPRVAPRARKIERIAYEEMLEMASLGAKVLQTRSVALAMRNRTPVEVRSSFEDAPGTLVVDEDEIVESRVVTGVAFSLDEAKVTMVGLQDTPGVAAAFLRPLAEAGINVDMIVQNVPTGGRLANITFTVPKRDMNRAVEALRAADGLDFEAIETDDAVAKVSVIGVGMRSHAGVAHQMFAALAAKSINIQAIATSEIKISVLVAEDYVELAVRALHGAFGLDAE